MRMECRVLQRIEKLRCVFCLHSTQDKSYLQHPSLLVRACDGGVGLDCPGLKVWLPANPEVPGQIQSKEDLVSLKFSEDIYSLGMML